MRVFTIIAMLLLVALAGCADNGKTNEATDGPTGTETGSGTSTQTGTSAPGNGGSEGNNTAPTASLVADALNGTAPFQVNFTLDGSDADGDNLTWSLTINGTETANGSALPAAANFTFGIGNHTVVLTVSDGALTAMANLTIAVEAGEPVDLGPCGGEPRCIVLSDRWVNFWSDGVCDMKPEFIREAGPLYYNDRTGPGGEPIIHFGGILASGGNGVWVYEESNGLAGMQVGGSDESPAYTGCVNPDTIIF